MKWVKEAIKLHHLRKRFPNSTFEGPVYYEVKNLKNIKVGEGCKINRRCYLMGNLSLGKDCIVNEGCELHGGSKERLSIGDGTHIASGTKVTCSNHMFESYDMMNKLCVETPVTIESNVWIGWNCIILRGTRIGEGAVIGAGSIVTKDVAPFTVVAGNPAKKVKERFDNESKNKKKELRELVWAV